jgi:WD40 repeat protein
MIRFCYRLKTVLIISMAFAFGGCRLSDPGKVIPAGREPLIEPDYSGVTIPSNIAPMNFQILEEGESHIVNLSLSDGNSETFRSSDGLVRFPPGKWKNILNSSRGGTIKIEVLSKDKEGITRKYEPFRMTVAGSPIDPYLCYRLLYPGYESWVEMQIITRSTESFREESLIENQLLDKNCINCHTFNHNSPERFLVHVRGSRGGTYFYDGEKIIRTSLRTDSMKANAVYPAWHPGGRFVVFSSNKTVQTFHMKAGKNIEVFDLFSSLVIYDTEKNEIYGCKDMDTVQYMETFPCWSPDGEYLYYCRTPQVKMEHDLTTVKYDLVRKHFNVSSGESGKAEIVFNAHEIGKSVSFPSISPDGKYLVLTLHDYGTFSIWHREADLYIIDLNSRKIEKMTVNSEESDSYHSWSSDGKWLVFSSKRTDGLTARTYFSWFESPDSVGKPFALPQKDPTLYRRMEKTFNRPELVTGKIEAGPRDFMNGSKEDPLKAVWTGEKK